MWHSCTIEETIRNLRTNIQRGLTKEEAKSRLEKYRRECIKRKKERKFTCSLYKTI